MKHTLQLLAIVAKLEVYKCIYQVRETSLTTGVSSQESHQDSGILIC